jgi:acetyl-CoA carboxylase, biotin carboxylase subunit
VAIRKLLVANRGEIAVRIIRAARELDIATVQAVSEADRESLAAAMADEVAEIGPPHATRSYLKAEAILDAARRTGADAIHPGYGFLSENAAFAAAVEAAGLVFVGPRAETIRLMGDKARAREAAARADVPTVPGTEGRIEDRAEAEARAAAIGFPVLIKAAAGGGGRGIRVVERAELFASLFDQAAAEARTAFGVGGLYVERFIPRARHVEVQVLGDGERAVHLFERECSLQRRRQKLWEEAPAVRLPEATRTALCASAVRLAQSVGYRGAGTVEYLCDEAGERFYFIEMNTRIQVEHPTTEMVTGVDLVREMIRIAAGEPWQLDQDAVVARGHAIECRLNAEDPARGFLPSPGQVTALRLPGGPGVRVDTALYAGCTVPPFYDSLLAKLIVWDGTRDAALARLRRALGEVAIEGIATTAPLLARLARDPEIAAGRVHTTWLEAWLAQHPAEGMPA